MSNYLSAHSKSSASFQSTKPALARAKNAGPTFLRRFVYVFIIALIILLFSGSYADGQAFYGSIVGTVTDASGALMPDTKVEITQTETNITRQATTNAAEIISSQPSRLEPTTYRYQNRVSASL